jgi:DNA-binding transcriptional MocR family regulator
MELVEKLISSCRHTQESFRCAAEVVNDTEWKRLFGIYAQQRTRFAEELREHLPPGADGAGNRGSGMVAWAEMEKNEILRECLDAEKRSLDLYSQALASRGMPTRAHFVVSAQFSLLQRVHDRVHGTFASNRKTESERA